MSDTLPRDGLVAVVKRDCPTCVLVEPVLRQLAASGRKLTVLTQDDPTQARKANALIDRTVREGERLHLDVVVLCELVWVLRGAYQTPKEAVADALDKILDTSQFHIEDRDLLREAVASYRGGQGDFADYVLGLRNRGGGCGATVTFDKSLRKSELFTQL